MIGAGKSTRRQTGFSLVELTTTIALTGILAVGLANLLQHPMNGYAAVSRRAELVALGDLAIRRMTRDLAQALPNSVRVSGDGTTVEFLLTSMGGRYRGDPGINQPGPSQQDHTDPTDVLSFGGDSRFNLIGRFLNRTTAYGSNLPSGTRIAIYPTGPGIWAEAAANANPALITPSTTTIRILDDGDEDQIRLSGDHRFRLESPNRRFYLVDTPVTYQCDPADASLWRVEGYSIASAQPLDRSAAPLRLGSAARTSDRVDRCRFAYNPGAPSRASLVTIELEIASGDERVRLLQQVPIDNAP